MFQFLKVIPIILSGVIIGIILYQSLLIAPSINKLLSTQDASIYLRYVWPKFFIIIGAISLISWILILNFSPDQSTAKIISIISFILMIICYVLIPYMNSAKDSANDSFFIFLHTPITSSLLCLLFILFNIKLSPD